MAKTDSLPLREKFTTAERLTRELIDHLEQGFLPKIKQLRRVCRKDESDGITDKTVRYECTRLLKSDAFTHELTGDLNDLLTGIAAEMEPIVFGREA